jgi:poly(3-hydroxybutyrate) depolymerase
LAGVSLMAARDDTLPVSLVLMGGPIDARKSPTAVNDLATQKSLSWFKNNLIYSVPDQYPGAGRLVYPGFLQHAGFVSMNPSRHMESHWEYYEDLLKGDEEDVRAHRDFYDEYNAVLDLSAEFYLETIKVVFQDYALPLGKWVVKGEKVDPSNIKNMALLTIEGELDDISGSGQTQAAHGLCANIPAQKKHHLTIEKCGHYGIFSGRKWREIIYPQLKSFIGQHQD